MPLKKIHIYSLIKTLAFFIILFFITNSYAQLSSEHYLPPLRQTGTTTAITQQAVYFSTPETTAFPIEIYKGTSTSVFLTITGLAKGAPKIFDNTNGLGNSNNNITLVNASNTGKVISGAGLRIVAPGGQKFYVNYRGRSGSQAGSLTSKGDKAKALEFRWGGLPNRGNNSTQNTVLGMMATENATTVVVSGYDPDCVFRIGGAAGGITADVQTISLNKGQTFVLEAVTNQSAANVDGWLGAKILADKPIVISNGGLNVGIRTGSGSRDVGIDQPVGVENLGREYVFVRGNGINGNSSLGRIGSEFPVIVATQNNTEVKAGNTVLGTINDGEYLVIDGSNYSANTPGSSMFVTTSKNVYAYQCLQGAAGSKIQTIGMNFIAPVNCLLPLIMDEISDIDKIAGSATNISAITIIASSLTNPDNIIVTQKVGGVTSTKTLPAPVAPEGTTDWQTFYIQGLEGEIDVSSTGPIAVGTFMSLGSNAGLAGYFSGFDTLPIVDLAISGGGCYPQTSIEESTGTFDKYQWYQDGQPIPDETNAQLLLIDASTGKDLGLGDFYLLVTQGTCSYASEVVPIFNCDPDVKLTKTADVNNLTDDDTITFTVEVTNTGVDPVSNLVINDAFPAQLDLVSATPTIGTWVNPNWTVGGLNSGQVQKLIIVAKVPKKPTEGTFTNTVSNTQDQVDSNQGIDDLTEDFTIAAKKIDLLLVKTVNKPIVKINDIVLFTITITNKGSDTATNVQVKDLLPSGLEYVSTGSIIPANTTYNSATGIWDFSSKDIVKDESVILKINAKVVNINTLILNTIEVFKTDQKDVNSLPNNSN